MYQSMIQYALFSTIIFSIDESLPSGGAPCPETIYHHSIEKGFNLKKDMDLTEAGPNNFFIRPEDACRKIGSVGKPMLFNSVKVLNEEGKPCGVR